MQMAKVVLIQEPNRRKAVREAVHQLGDAWIDKVKSSRRIIVKVNLVHHETQLASTHVDAVRGLLDEIRQHSRVDVFVGDASYHGTKAAFANFGYERLIEEYEHTILVDLNDDDTVLGHSVRADGSLNEIRRSRLASECDLRISLTPMKTHRDAGISLSVKNWTLGTWVVPPRVGTHGRVWARWPWLHNEGMKAFHETVTTLYEELPCHVGIVDGTIAMEGDGPTRGDAVQMGVVLAGLDAVAVDAVGATLMGFDPGEIGYLVKCSERGLGVAEMSRIDAPPLVLEQLRRSFLRPPELAEKLTAWK
ncbi:DUF362 domain-containing protein [Candidatus Uhrbacteria bacterium]|nr:DUF362 domain-containing protein [Candidatus Uhrbacteria bacterium]